VIRKILGFILLLGFTIPSFSAPPAAPALPAAAKATETISATNSTDGLELPPDQTVRFDEGFVTIQAKCSGEVKWLVVSSVKIKYFTLPSNAIIVSVPPQGGLVTVFAVGLVKDKLTDFARTSITVSPGPCDPGPFPGPFPGPDPFPAAKAMHVTIIADANAVTPALGQILDSQKVKDLIKAKNGIYRLYDVSDPVLKQKGLDRVVAASGGAPIVIVQRSDGSVVGNKGAKIPTTEAEMIQYLTQALAQ
jgi:hypothetical protein